MDTDTVSDRVERLSGWKEIASFLGRDESTVKRWESLRGLPIHRLPGDRRGGVYAFKSELEAWLAGGDADTAPNPPSPPEPRVRRRPLLIAGLAAGVAGALVGLAATVKPHPSLQPQKVEAAELYKRGLYLWNQRTPQSLNAAVDAFTQAIVKDPGDADAYAGLANCYLLLREFSVMPAAEAYPRAKDAAQRALALDDTSSDAHLALGFVHFWWDWDRAGAWREFQRASALKPAAATPHHWYATALLGAGEPEKALHEIEKAQSLEPASGAIVADKAFILAALGRTGEAERLLLDVAHANPQLSSPWQYLFDLYRDAGRYPEALEALDHAAALRGSTQLAALAKAGRVGLAEGGPPGLAKAILRKDLQQQAPHPGYPVRIAEEYELAGDVPNAVAQLRSALAEHDPDLPGIGGADNLKRARADPALHGQLVSAGLLSP